MKSISFLTGMQTLTLHSWCIFVDTWSETLLPETYISGMDNQVRPIEFCRMQLLIPVWDTSGAKVVMYSVV